MGLDASPVIQVLEGGSLHTAQSIALGNYHEAGNIVVSDSARAQAHFERLADAQLPLNPAAIAAAADPSPVPAADFSPSPSLPGPTSPQASHDYHAQIDISGGNVPFPSAEAADCPDAAAGGGGHTTAGACFARLAHLPPWLDARLQMAMDADNVPAIALSTFTALTPAPVAPRNAA